MYSISIYTIVFRTEPYLQRERLMNATLCMSAQTICNFHYYIINLRILISCNHLLRTYIYKISFSLTKAKHSMYIYSNTSWTYSVSCIIYSVFCIRYSVFCYSAFCFLHSVLYICILYRMLCVYCDFQGPPLAVSITNTISLPSTLFRSGLDKRVIRVDIPVFTT